MAVFGAPTAHGDDAERAVRAGLRVLSGMDDLNREHGLELAARAAVSTGDAVVAVDGGAGEPLAMGDVVNTAARLQSAAPEGGLLVGAETYRASRSGITYEPHQAVDAKGKAQAVEAWLAVAAAADGMERTVRRAPLVGRSRELDLMHSAWLQCVDERRPHLVTVLGPPGIGKSRLCHEFSERVAGSDGRILRGRCLPYEEQVGYQAFSRLVSASSGIVGSDEPEAARGKLRVTVDRLMPEDEAAETFRYLALLLGLAPEDAAQQLLLPFFAARRFVACVGHEQPTVFVFEDIHWAQPSEIALLQYLTQHLRDSPVVLVVAARPELLDNHATWGAGLAAQTIPLDPLSAEDAAALAARLLPQQAGAVDLGRIIETAGGNPLVLDELSASVAELSAGSDLPVTVREAIAARIDALPADARGALLSAAVVGRTFWRRRQTWPGEAGRRTPWSISTRWRSSWRRTRPSGGESGSTAESRSSSSPTTREPYRSSATLFPSSTARRSSTPCSRSATPISGPSTRRPCSRRSRRQALSSVSSTTRLRVQPSPHSRARPSRCAGPRETSTGPSSWASGRSPNGCPEAGSSHSGTSCTCTPTPPTGPAGTSGRSSSRERPGRSQPTSKAQSPYCVRAGTRRSRSSPSDATRKRSRSGTSSSGSRATTGAAPTSCSTTPRSRTASCTCSKRHTAAPRKPSSSRHSWRSACRASSRARISSSRCCSSETSEPRRRPGRPGGKG